MKFGLRRIAAGTIAGVLVLGLGACGDDKKDSADDSTADTTATTLGATTTSGSSAAAPNMIEISGFKFAPDTLTVAAGATVAVTNKDSAPHTVTAEDGSFDTKTVAGNASGSFTAPAKAGSYKYKCNFHANMEHKTLIVK